MLKKAYIEISNVCNLSCSFCHGTARPPRMMNRAEFERVLSELHGKVEFVYFHLLGEPLLHPSLSEFLSLSFEYGFKVMITTNGTLLSECSDILLSSDALYKVSVSLHSFEANDTSIDFERYLSDCFDFAQRIAERGKICALRLWNKGGEDRLNKYISARLHEEFCDEWKQTRSGFRLAERVYLEWGDHFEWPDLRASDMGGDISCWGLRDQIGVLADGTVVPCCLDAEGDIPLGNIYTTPLSDILSSDRAVSLRRSFECRRVSEPLCLRCGYAHQKRY